MFLIAPFLTAQQSEFWLKIDGAKIGISKFQRQIHPKKYKSFRLDLEGEKNKLKLAPNTNSNLLDSKLIISFTNENGEMKQYHLDKFGYTGSDETEQKAIIMAELTMVVTKINAIYEQELAIRFELAEFRIDPNLSEGSIQIAFNSEEPAPVVILLFDLLGRKIFDKAYNNVGTDIKENLYLKGVSSGIYILQVKKG